MEQITERWTFWRVAKLVCAGLLLGLVLIILGGTLLLGFLLWMAGDAPPAMPS